MDKIEFKNLKIIHNKKGDVLKGFLGSENKDFIVKEVYFSEIKPNEIKAWKRHKLMKSNLIVLRGEVKIAVEIENGKFISETISKNNFKLITIPPKKWYGFCSMSNELGLVANISDHEHLDSESEEKEINKIKFNWFDKN